MSEKEERVKLTVEIPRSLWEKIKIEAAKRRTTLNRLIAEKISAGKGVSNDR